MRKEYDFSGGVRGKYAKLLKEPAMKTLLIVIDPQESFCNPNIAPEDQQIVHNGELAVPGAKEDMERLGNFIHKATGLITDIAVTLDSHNLIDISHPQMYRRAATGTTAACFSTAQKNQIPASFTCLHEEDEKIFDSNGIEYNPVNEDWRIRIVDYLRTLVARKRYPHIIWPPHCLLGTAGHCMVRPIMDAVFNWEFVHTKNALKISKGMNEWTEHFSAIRAEVPDPMDSNTETCWPLILKIREADEVLWSGEALSHCLANTFNDAAYQVDDHPEKMQKKSIILTDTTSSVPGFEMIGQEFLEKAKSAGTRLMTTTEYLA